VVVVDDVFLYEVVDGFVVYEYEWRFCVHDVLDLCVYCFVLVFVGFLGGLGDEFVDCWVGVVGCVDGVVGGDDEGVEVVGVD